VHGELQNAEGINDSPYARRHLGRTRPPTAVFGPFVQRASKWLLIAYSVQLTLVKLREAPDGKTTLAVVVQTLFRSQLPSGGAWITVSATAFSLRTVREIVAVIGILLV
jgi:hypothetical protein